MSAAQTTMMTEDHQKRGDPGSVQSGTVLTRTVHVSINGSLANLAMQGVNAAIWKPVEGKQIHVFGAEMDSDAQIATNQLRTALIHEVQLLEHRWDILFFFSFFGIDTCGGQVDVPGADGGEHRVRAEAGEDGPRRGVRVHHPAALEDQLAARALPV